jgi:hypothetical protein
MSCGGNTGSAVDVDPKIIVTSSPPLACVHSHTHAQRLPVRPLVAVEGALGRYGGLYRAPGGGEHGEEGIAFSANLGSPLGGDGFSHETHVVVLDRLVT